MGAAIGAILLAIFVVGAWLGSGLVRSIFEVLCFFPGLGCLCLCSICGYRSLEKSWMIYQIAQGVDVDKKSNVLLRSGVWGVLVTSLCFGITVLWATWSITTFGIDRTGVGLALMFGCVPGIFAYGGGRGTIDAFLNMGRCEVIERREIRDIEEALCQLRKEIGHGTPQPPSRETIEAFDAALMELRQSFFFKDLQTRKCVSPDP